MSYFKKTIALLFLGFINLNLYAELRIVSRQPTEIFLFYSSSPGQSALDGTGRNSPFAESFLKNIGSKEPLLMVAADIASDTFTLTSQRQRPVFESYIYNNKNYSISESSSTKRYALVIGINDYYNADVKIANPANDAQDITSALRKFGYEVDLRINVASSDMRSAVGDFYRKLGSDKDSEGFFWFGGIGFEIYGENYLLPADSKIASEFEIRNSSVSLDFLLNELQLVGNNMNLIFLDASRTSLSSSTR